MKRKIVCALLAGLMVLGGSVQAFAQSHTVVWGDCLWTIARDYHTTIEAVAKANGILNPDRIYVGQELIIPGQADHTYDGAGGAGGPGEAGSAEQERDTVGVQAMQAAIDPEYTKEVMFTIGSFGDDPVMGNRSAGSQAEYQASQYIVDQMQQIGLSNVTVDEIKVDTWSFNGASVTITNGDGAVETLHLGGYATHLVTEEESVPLVYAGKGTAADYEDMDVEGKLVLVDIDQYNEWWINWPAYQAYLKGAKALLAVNTAGYAQFNDDTTGSQDICGPEYAPAFAINQTNANKLKALIAESQSGEINVAFSANSVVERGGSSQNVWGEIPGRTDDVIYFIAHYDGYYHSVFDDAAGVATILTIAKAMVAQGYTPEKTVRFVTHGAEEWGKADSAYDWALGAYEQIMTVHPEWAEKAFMLLNVDGCYPLPEETVVSIAANYETAGYAHAFAEGKKGETGYAIYVSSPASTGTEDFIYTRSGVPAIVGVSSKESTSPYREGAYHSSADSKELGFNPAYSAFVSYYFLAMAVELDGYLLKPLNLAAHLEVVRDSIDTEIVGAEVFDTANEAYEKAIPLYDSIVRINNAYMNALQSGDTETVERLRGAAGVVNGKLYEVFKEIQEKFVRLGWEENITAPHENYQENVQLLQAAIDGLENGDIETVLDEYLWDVDYNWYAYDFDKEAYTYFAGMYRENAGGTFGEGLLRYPNEDLYEVIQSLLQKTAEVNPGLGDEIEALENALQNQEMYLNEIIAAEKEDLEEVMASIESLLKIIETM